MRISTNTTTAARSDNGDVGAARGPCLVAGKSTLNRVDLSRLQPTRYRSHNPMAIGRLFVDLFLEAYEEGPSQIILDLNATDDPVHGEQEGRFFHGYCDRYCYLLLYSFRGHHLLAAKLRLGRGGRCGIVARIRHMSLLWRDDM